MAVGLLWLYRPFPAACPSKLAMTKRCASPLTDPTVQNYRSGFFKPTHRTARGRMIRGLSSGRRSSSSRYSSHVRVFPRVRRFSHLRHSRRTPR